MTNTQDRSRADPICRVETESMTYALKAKRLLGSNALLVNVVKLSSKSSDRGCTYGIEFPCSAYGRVKNILESSGITVK